MDRRKRRDSLNYLYTRLPHDGKQGKIRLDVQIDKQFIDRASYKNRPQLQALLTEIKDGDKVYVETISRFAYDVDDFIVLSDQFIAKGATLYFIREGFDTSSRMHNFALTILDAVKEMEFETTAIRIREGIEKAKRYGTKSGRPHGRPSPRHPVTLAEIYDKVQQGKYTKVQAAKFLGVSRATLYRWFEAYEKSRS